MKPTVGRIVHYTFTEQDADAINVRRADYRAFEAPHRHPHEPGTPGATGHIVHVGNTAREGDVCAAVLGDRRRDAGATGPERLVRQS